MEGKGREGKGREGKSLGNGKKNNFLSSFKI